ncbi:MAG TPA: copper homeostasis membrane protein CopD [Magnetospirillaceae bacterium]|jgi:putative copper resistance protein D
MSALIVVCLFFHYAAAMMLFGAALFRLTIPDEGIDALLLRVFRTLLAVAVISAVAMLMAASGAMGGGWAYAVDVQTITDVFTGTSFGKVWQWHLGLAVLMGVAIRFSQPARPWIASMAMLHLASLALVGHAAMVEGAMGGLRRLNQAVHLLSAGAWLGGLIPLALVLWQMRNRPVSASPLLQRFSTFGMIAVVLVLVTGSINSIALVGTFDGLMASSYGHALLIKLALVAVMICFALFNRFYLLRRLAGNSTRAAFHLRLSVILEVVVGVAVILLASILGTLPPPIG